MRFFVLGRQGKMDLSTSKMAPVSEVSTENTHCDQNQEIDQEEAANVDDDEKVPSVLLALPSEVSRNKNNYTRFNV